MEQLRKGYKKTEVGIIPEEWTIKQLGELCCPSSFRINPISSSLSYRCIELEHLSQGDGRLIGFADSKDLLSQKTRFEKGDVLFGKLRPYLRKYYFADFDGVCTTEIWVLKCNKTIYNRLLYQIIQTDKIIEAANISTGTKMPRAEWKTVSETLITIPSSISEQKAIADALSDVDALIANLEKLIAKKKAIKQGAMQQLLTPPHKGGKRLEGFSGEWKEVKLGEIGQITGAGVDKKINPDEPPVTLLNYLDVYRRDYLYSHELNHVVTAPAYKIENCSIKKGDIFLTPSSELRTDIGVSALAMEDMTGVVYSYHLYRLRYKHEIDILYSLYMLKTKEFLCQAETMCEGSGKRYVVSMSKFSSMIVYLPSDINEQKAIGKIIYEIDCQIQALDIKKSKIISIKQGMMQELLTGKTRLI